MSREIRRPTCAHGLVMIAGLIVGCGDPEGYTGPRDGGGGAPAIGTAGSGGGPSGPAGFSGAAGDANTGGGTGVAGGGGAGSTGLAGTSGLAGTNGAAGTSSAAGTTGGAGTTGVAGTTGAAGTTGIAGASGAAGAGAAGTTGAAGAGAAGAGGTPVTGACAGKVKTAAAVVDTFEDGVLTGWYEYKDATATATLAPLAIASPGANATAKAIHLQGSGFQGFGAGMGLMMACTNASAFQGITFWAKGASGTSNDIALQVAIPETQAVADLGDCTTKCYDHPSKKVLLTASWQQYSVKFTDLAQAGFGTPATYRGLVMALNFVSVEGPNVDFQVDEIAFY